MFANAPPEMKAWALRRHSEMEGDYQRRVQANAAAAEFAGVLARDVFTDPVIARSLQEVGASPYDAVTQWAGFHKRAMDPSPEVRIGLLRDLATRMKLDPAVVGHVSLPDPSPVPGLPPELMKDPAIRVFADHIGKQSSEVRALKESLHNMTQQSEQRRSEESLRVTRWGIDSFAEEKGVDGQPLHPHFDRVLPQIIELFRANPKRDLREAYETALWMVPEVRATLQQQQAARAAKVEADKRAAQAARSNLRGRTVPVAAPRPNGQATPSLRETLEASADEVGY